jgi:hypothetical protein
MKTQQFLNKVEALTANMQANILDKAKQLTISGAVDFDSYDNKDYYTKDAGLEKRKKIRLGYMT